MKVEPKEIEWDGPVCDMLFKIREKPRNIVRCRASNVWDNRWRIDIYTKYMVDPDTGLEGQEISYSCFAHMKDDGLDIKSESLKL